jgi:hypothetical protein|tara:strand:- start:238 stop:603 length:366 start_codon:yes stop_codon:yes gene_type:complete
LNGFIDKKRDDGRLEALHAYVGQRSPVAHFFSEIPFGIKNTTLLSLLHRVPQTAPPVLKILIVAPLPTSALGATSASGWTAFLLHVAIQISSTENHETLSFRGEGVPLDEMHEVFRMTNSA